MKRSTISNDSRAYSHLRIGLFLFVGDLTKMVLILGIGLDFGGIGCEFHGIGLDLGGIGLDFSKLVSDIHLLDKQRLV